MAIKPILFKTEMVRAILDGRKTCTRRILKGAIPFDEKAEYWNVLKKGEWSGPICVEYFMKQGSPYKPGDILYVRETWSLRFDGEKYFYKADKNTSREEKHLLDYDDVRWHPSIHMPKEAARFERRRGRRQMRPCRLRSLRMYGLHEYRMVRTTNSGIYADLGQHHQEIRH